MREPLGLDDQGRCRGGLGVPVGPGVGVTDGSEIPGSEPVGTGMGVDATHGPTHLEYVAASGTSISMRTDWLNGTGGKFPED